MSAVIGVDAIASRNTAAWATPTWATVANLMDITLGMTLQEYEMAIRGLQFGVYLPTVFQLEVTGGLVYNTGDASVAAILTSFWGRSAIDLAFTDVAIATSGAEGVRAPWQVFGCTRNELVREALRYDLTLKPRFTGSATEVPGRWQTE